MAKVDRQIFRRLLLAIRSLLTSEIGGTVKLLLLLILLLLVGINGLNVVNSFVGRDLMTAIEERSASRFLTKASLWAAVFAALTAAAVLLRFVEERLALLWRQWLTRHLLTGYLEGGNYLRLKERGELGNPDQRIADDARAFTATTLSFFLLLLNALFGILAFSGVLWSISPPLFIVAVVYAALGSVFTIAVGRPLVRLSYDQSDREASFRAELLHAGENAASIASLQYEGRVLARLCTRLDALAFNMKRIVAINRNVGFFTTGYNYGIQLLPPLIVGPLFMTGKVEFGVITQSAMAFAQLLGAFSLIINQFGSISSYAAVLVRLGAFSAALEREPARAACPASTRAGAAARLVFDDLSLYSKSTGECLLSHLSLEIATGTHLLITGTDEAQRALFRAMALRGDAQAGRVICPGDQQVLFLPERPYTPPATLRELLVRSVHESELSDARIEATLRELGLAGALQRMGGLDCEGDCSHALSLGEQQLLAVARVVLAAPPFAVLHNPGATLAPDQLEVALTRLAAASVTYLTLGGSDAQLSTYGALLEIHAGGAWSFSDRTRTEPLALGSLPVDGQPIHHRIERTTGSPGARASKP